MSLFYWDQDLTATDFFCGAGAFGSGVEQGGARLNLAVNHDPRSIATHRKNFPRAKHLCMRMEDVDFAQECDSLLGTGSPECRFQTPAAGEKLDDQEQLAMWTDYDDKPHVKQSRIEKLEQEIATQKHVTLTIVDWGWSCKQHIGYVVLQWIADTVEEEEYARYLERLQPMDAINDVCVYERSSA